MRIQILAALGALLVAGTVTAAESETESAIRGTPGRYGAAGCGLGSMAFGNTPGAVQILAATTNSLFGSQTFGITTGTSNCGEGVLKAGTRDFVEANREALAKDISRGEGEAIGALTWMNGCKDSREVGAALQSSFGKIFPSAETSNEAVTNAILNTLHSDASLGCAKG
jgi:hypothetical protein